MKGECLECGNHKELSTKSHNMEICEDCTIRLGYEETSEPVESKNESMKKSTIKNVMQGLLFSFEKEDKELFEKVMDGVDLSMVTDGDTFEVLLNYQFKKFLKGFISVKFGNSHDIKFTLLNHRFLETHFVKWIEQIEGSACSADKSRTIMRRLLTFHQTGEEIAWNYEGEYTYHLPTKVFTTHTEILSFYEGLKSLFYGEPTGYLKHFQDFLIQKP